MTTDQASARAAREGGFPFFEKVVTPTSVGQTAISFVVDKRYVGDYILMCYNGTDKDVTLTFKGSYTLDTSDPTQWVVISGSLAVTTLTTDYVLLSDPFLFVEVTATFAAEVTSGELDITAVNGAGKNRL